MFESQFAWRGVNRAGLTLTGVSTARSKAEVHNALLAQRIRPVRIQKQWQLKARPIKRQHITLFTRQLSSLISASVPLNEGLKIVSPMSSVLAYQEAVQNVDRLIMQGQSLSQAMQSQGATFPDLVIQLCWIGEESGTLETMLANIAQHYEAEIRALWHSLACCSSPSSCWF